MATHLDDLRAQARTLPEVPGVYFWKDGRGNTLYIGKAVNLRARVTSYFSNARRDRRTRDLLQRARSIEHEVAGTELEALFRESALIKQELPRFNRALRTTRKGFYLKVDAALEDPYLKVARDLDEDGSQYFGPFRSGAVLRETIDYLHHVLPLRKCQRANPRCKPCLYYQMHTCAAPLIDEEHRRHHQEALAQLFELLDGRSDRLVAWLESKRDRLSEALMFERAAEVQERLNLLHELLRRQDILDAAVRSRCVLIAELSDEAAPQRLLLVARGQVISVREVGLREVPDVVQWIRAHEAVIRAITMQQSEIDAASVLERWLNVHRHSVRWVAIPSDADQDEIVERTHYVLRSSKTATAESL